MSRLESSRGQGGGRGSRGAGALVGLLLGAGMVLWGWGYTVDDALITARVAANLSAGLGYRVNPSGELVDAVTPLGYAHLLALAKPASALEALQIARTAGAAAWLVTMAWLGAWLARFGARGLGWLALFALVPCAGAWASSGMETPWACLLVALGAALMLDFAGDFGGLAGHWGLGPRLVRCLPGALALGVAAAWRPELLPAVLVLWLGAAGLLPAWRWRLLLLAVGLLPSALVIAARLIWFEGPAPLSSLAKPSDLPHGLRYALGGWILSGYLCVVAPWGLGRLSYAGRVAAAALGAHAVSLVLVGGDWMALFRLYVPVLPLAARVAAELAWRTHWGSQLARGALVLTAAGLMQWHSGASARHVMADRERLIEAATPHLTGRRVAALDVGWVLATGAEVIDLAGVTDPRIAELPGGHTSKQIDPHLLERRRAEAVVLLHEPGAELPARQVERRLLRELTELKGAERVTLPLGKGGQTYIIHTIQPDL
ncbi:MAG: hypothetical protein KIT72_12350 [Polyangiaceae bacterium]|nr:hypothetical protein [Polyangiaceae bacterium]MCW5791204.1 hypothetical protein [Polyangiaceae bacterium]